MNTENMTLNWGTTTAFAVCVALVACDLGGESGLQPTFGCLSDAATFYVSATADEANPGTGATSCDGGTLEAALASAKTTIHLSGDAFTLQKTLVLADGQTLSGDREKTVVTCPTDADCVRLQKSGVVRGVQLKDGGGHGVVGGGTSVSVEDSKITGMKGDGLHAEGPVSILVQKTEISGNAGRGIYAKGIGSLSVIDPVYSPKAFLSDTPIGVIDPVYQPASVIADNGQGGIAVIDPVYSPKSDKFSDAISVTNTMIRGNGRYGIGLWGSALSLSNSVITTTKTTKGGPWADGLLVAKGSKTTELAAILVQDSSVISGNGRTGILVATSAKVDVAGRVQNNGLGGIWAHGDKTVVTLGKATMIHGNRAVGVVVTQGADLQLDGSTIAASKLHQFAGETSMGDGIGVYNGARATIRNAELLDNERAAIVVHSAKKNGSGEADVVVDGCNMSGSEYTFVINGAPVPAAAAAENNKAESSSDNTGTSSSSSSGSSSGGQAKSNGYTSNASLPVQTGYCEGKDPDESGECTAEP